MIDNFEQIKDLLNFESEDDFYFCQIVKRKKENKELGSNSYIAKTYFIKSLEDLDKNKEEMILLANYHNARVCINLNKRSFRKTAFNTLKKISDQLLNQDYPNVRRAYNSVCGMQNNSDKLWLIDIDEKGEKGEELVESVVNETAFYPPLGFKYVAKVETKNGFHVISKPFNMELFSRDFPNIEVHKNNPTILYVP